MHMLALRRKERLVDPLQRLRSISRKLATAAAVLMVVVTAIVAVAWFLPTFTDFRFFPRIARLRGMAVDPALRFAVIVVVMVLLGLFLFALDQARRLFVDFAAGEVLTVKAAERLQYIAYAIIAGSIFRPVAQVVLRSAFSFDLAVVPRPIAGVLSLRDILDNMAFMFVGFMVLAVAWALTEAARIAADYRQIV